MKTCNRCKEEKPLEEFGKRKDSPDGRKYYCKSCGIVLAAEQRKRNPDKESARQKAYYHRNRQKQIEKAARWTRENRNRVNKHRRESGLSAAAQAKRRAAKRQQTPRWTDHKSIKRIYSACARITKETGVPHEVDHIVPIQGANVSGLHVPWNMQVTTAEMNKIKGNRI